jgi:hypothetical protein
MKPRRLIVWLHARSETRTTVARFLLSVAEAFDTRLNEPQVSDVSR